MNRFFQSEDGDLFAIEQIKINLLVLVNADLKASLSKTDWQVVRAADQTSKKVLSETVQSERQAARDLAVLLETQISNANTIEALQEIYNQHL
jgi:adenylate kinase